MARYCASCGAMMTEEQTTCPSCGKAAGAPAAGGGAAASGGGLSDNVAALLGYLFGVIAIVWLLIEPYNKNKFIRFHAFQCLFFLAAWIGINIVLGILGAIPGVGLVTILLWPLAGLGVLVLWIVLMIKAYQGQKWKLPFIGDLAEKQAG
ncbi:MAG TPA: DUF4870 domain-containing protein [Terriglobales bacterium]|nr:DUF4870 domain-containing protein [Terriglobales bacterium]